MHLNANFDGILRGQMPFLPPTYSSQETMLILFREISFFMPQAGTKDKFLFGQIFLLPNLVDYKNNTYATNIELLRYAAQSLKDKNIIYPIYFSSAPIRGIGNKRSLAFCNICIDLAKLS